jgi:hypothetical protein
LDILIHLIMSHCARPECQIAAKSSCSGCGREYYCGSDCQKLDWKAHKSICSILKRLPNKLQHFHEAVRIVEEILKSNNTRVLEHLLSYADYQFGKPVAERDYRERPDGQRIDNWDVDLTILIQIRSKIIDIYSSTLAHSPIIRDNKMFLHLKRSLHILSPWIVTIDSDANSLDFEQTNELLLISFTTEGNMAMVAMHRRQFDVAEGHCHRRLAHSRKFSIEGELKTTSIFNALGCYVDLRQYQGDFSGAVTFAEEAYNICVDAYDPVHFQVQQAAGMLIRCYIFIFYYLYVDSLTYAFGWSAFLV